MEGQSSPNVQTARIICGALMLGVVVFWIAAFVLTGGENGFGSDLPLDPTLLLAIVIAVALGSFGAALAFRSKALRPSSSASRLDDPPASSNVLTNLIIAWALLEGQALIAGVFFMLTGEANLLIISALVFLLGFAVTFPRAEWFAPAHRSSSETSL